jgi:hypothetical protein
MVERLGADWKNYATHTRFTFNPGENIARFWPGGPQTIGDTLNLG